METERWACSPTGVAPETVEAVYALAVAESDPSRREAGLAAMVRAIDPLLDESTRCKVVAAVSHRLHGLGPLEPVLASPSVTEVMINGPGPVWVERGGQVQITDVVLDRDSIELIVERIIMPLGLRADRTAPLVDARLADGSRVNAVMPPLAVDGPYVTIRRFASEVFDLSSFGSPAQVRLLTWAVGARLNVVISGGTGAGKTSLLNALATHIDSGERIVTVEDAAELQLPGSHVVRLESRPANAEGVGHVAIRDLVRNALRMRPDRIIVGEVRGGEALDMVQAMTTGHEGSLSTCHANTPSDALRRLETMIVMNALDLPMATISETLRSAIDLIVQVSRDEDGHRTIAEICTIDRNGVRPLNFEPADGATDQFVVARRRGIEPYRVGPVRPCTA